jgi:hypothetical protein
MTKKRKEQRLNVIYASQPMYSDEEDLFWRTLGVSHADWSFIGASFDVLL